MMDSTRDKGAGASDGGESSVDYQIREVEARLARRLDTLESQRLQLRRMARLTGAGLAATLVVLVLVILSTASGDHDSLTTETLLAEEVVLRDADRVTRGRLGMDDDGRVQLSLSDRDGRERIRLTVLADGSPGVTISDADDRPRAVLGYLPDGTTSLVFADAEGISRAVVGLGPDGSSHSLFADQAGLIRAVVGVGAEGVPTMSLVEDDEAAVSPDTVASY